MVQLANGMRDVQRGFRVLRAHPRLWRWVIAPAVLTAALIVGLIVAVTRLIDPVVGWLSSHAPGPLGRFIDSIAGSVVTAVVTFGLSIGGLFVFVAVAGMIAGPFNEVLSERIEVALTGTPPPPSTLAGFVWGVVIGIVHSLRRLLASLVGLVFVFALGFVPVVGTVAALVLAAWFTATGAAYDCYDAVLGRRSMAYRAKLAYLAHHRQRTLGLGAAIAGMMFVPGLNLIALGVGAAGATVATLEARQRATT